MSANYDARSVWQRSDSWILTFFNVDRIFIFIFELGSLAVTVQNFDFDFQSKDLKI